VNQSGDIAAIAGMDSPERVLGSGRGDATALLLVWCLRRTATPLFFLGATVAGLNGDLARNLAARLDTPEEVVSALLSPLAGIALALMARVVSSMLGWLLAYPLTKRWSQTYDANEDLGAYRRWYDRWQVTGSYRSLRWTWSVRNAAVRRLGSLGQVLNAFNPFALVVSWVAFFVFATAYILGLFAPPGG